MEHEAKQIIREQLVSPHYTDVWVAAVSTDRPWLPEPDIRYDAHAAQSVSLLLEEVVDADELLDHLAALVGEGAVVAVRGHLDEARRLVGSVARSVLAADRARIEQTVDEAERLSDERTAHNRLKGRLRNALDLNDNATAALVRCRRANGILVEALELQRTQKGHLRAWARDAIAAAGEALLPPDDIDAEVLTDYCVESAADPALTINESNEPGR